MERPLLSTLNFIKLYPVESNPRLSDKKVEIKLQSHDFYIKNHFNRDLLYSRKIAV